ncbi:MAG: sugar nucleotide-binding protein [Elusimicrobiales bacterium]
MKILVIGASGQVGGAILRECGNYSIEAKGTSAKSDAGGLLKADIRLSHAFEEIFESFKPDAAILCAAMTDPDLCQENERQAEQVNVEGARNILRLCDLHKTRLACLSTDNVFDGARGPYDETAKPNPVNVYGQTKLKAEKICAGASFGSVIIRSSGVYGADSPNLLTQIMDKAGKNERMELSSTEYCTPTFAPDLAAAVLLLVLKEKTGLYHAAGPDFVSRYEFAQIACQRLGIPADMITPVNAQPGQKAPRPRLAGLVSKKLLDETGYAMMNPVHALSVARDGIAQKKRRAASARPDAAQPPGTDGAVAQSADAVSQTARTAGQSETQPETAGKPPFRTEKEAPPGTERNAPDAPPRADSPAPSPPSPAQTGRAVPPLPGQTGRAAPPPPPSPSQTGRAAPPPPGQTGRAAPAPPSRTGHAAPPPPSPSQTGRAAPPPPGQTGRAVAPPPPSPSQTGRSAPPETGTPA